MIAAVLCAMLWVFVVCDVHMYAVHVHYNGLKLYFKHHLNNVHNAP